MIQLDDSRPIGDRVAVCERLQRETRCGKRELRQPVGAQASRLRSQNHVVIEVLVPIVGDDRRAFRQGRSDSAGMIPMMVDIDGIADRLVRDQLMSFGEHGV